MTLMTLFSLVLNNHIYTRVDECTQQLMKNYICTRQPFFLNELKTENTYKKQKQCLRKCMVIRGSY